MISKHHQINFNTLTRAARAGDLCLLETTDAVTNLPVIAICAAQCTPNVRLMET